MVLVVRRPKWVSLAKIKVLAFSLEAVEENSSHCLFKLPDAACIPWFVVPLNLPSQQYLGSLLHTTISDSFFQFPLPPLYCCIKFLTATILNYYQFTSLITHLLSYHYGSQKSEMACTGLKSRCRQDHTPSRGPKRESISLSFPVSRGHSLDAWNLPQFS